MTRKQGGLGRHPGKKRAACKSGAQQPSLVSARDLAAALRDAEALVGLATHTSPSAEGPTPPTRPPAQPGTYRFERERADALEKKFQNERELKRDANARARASDAKLERATGLSAQRLKDRDEAQESQRSWREDLHDLEDEMDGLASETIVADLPAIGKAKRGVGGGKGEKRWPMWMVQLILEQLIHGTPPAAIPDNILSQDRLTTGREGQELPSVGFCRDMRIVLNILIPGKCSAKYKKGEAVMMRWDADLARKEPVSESTYRLLRSKWNPKHVQSEGGWRLDL